MDCQVISIHGFGCPESHSAQNGRETRQRMHIKIQNKKKRVWQKTFWMLSQKTFEVIDHLLASVEKTFFLFWRGGQPVTTCMCC